MSYLDIENVTFSYDNGPVLKGLNLNVGAGEMVGLLGPNGSGKTTLIKLISGILRPKQGEIRFENASLAQLPRQSVARSIAVVPQEFDIPFAFRVDEVVMMGRTPFHGLFDGENGKDREAVASAIKLARLTGMTEKHWNELSGGEKQKVILATAFAQEPRLLLLDEPTVHLDIANQVEILELVKDLNRQSGLTVIAAIHDLNMAAMYFDRLVLLKEGRILSDGAPRDVLTENNIREAFAAGVRVGADPTTGAPHVYILPQTSGEKKNGKT
jgi:iron complex transport system ATP-binding protein